MHAAYSSAVSAGGVEVELEVAFVGPRVKNPEIDCRGGFSVHSIRE